MWVVGEDGPAGGRPVARHRPGVGGTLDADPLVEGLDVASQPLDDPSRGAGRRRHVVPLRVGGLDGGQSLRSVLRQDEETRQLGVPVGGQEEADEGEDRHSVRRVEGGGAGAQQGELVLVGGGAVPTPGVDPIGVAGGEGHLGGGEVLQLGGPHAGETDAAGEPVDGDELVPEQVGQRAARRPLQDLELEGAVLSVAEADAEGGVAVVGGLDVGNAEAVSPDPHPVGDAGHGQLTVGDDGTTSQ